MFKNYKLKGLKSNLGNLYDSTNCLVCHVEKEKLAKECKDGRLIIDTTRFKKKNDIDKNIIFNIRDYNFKDGLFLITDADVSFSNCTFHDDIYIEKAKNLVFEDNIYCNNTRNYKYSDRYMDINNAKRVIFMNDSITNETSIEKISTKMTVDEIHFINTNVFNDDISSSNLQAKRIYLANSIIDGYSTFIKSDHLIMTAESKVISYKSIFVETKSKFDDKAFKSEQIIINGFKKESSYKSHLLSK